MSLLGDVTSLKGLRSVASTIFGVWNHVIENYYDVTGHITDVHEFKKKRFFKKKYFGSWKSDGTFNGAESYSRNTFCRNFVKKVLFRFYRIVSLESGRASLYWQFPGIAHLTPYLVIGLPRACAFGEVWLAKYSLVLEQESKAKVVLVFLFRSWHLQVSCTTNSDFHIGIQ